MQEKSEQTITVPQYGRILPICAKDTPHFWSEVYKLGTRARKAQADVKNFIQGTQNVRSVGQMRRKFLTTCTIKGTRGGNLQADVLQYGRSMIEMLGVLAIIGVLSVGGIAGYTKAMMKVKTNKTVDLISQIVANTQTLYKSQDSYAGLNDAVVKKAKLVPDSYASYSKSGSYSIDSLWGYGSVTSSMVSPFGGGLAITPSSRSNWGKVDDKAFAIVLYDVPEDACIELLTMDWGSTTSGLIAVGINNNTWDTYALEGCSGSSSSVNTKKMVFACPGKSGITVPMPVSLAAESCSGNNNSLFWKYY